MSNVRALVVHLVHWWALSVEFKATVRALRVTSEQVEYAGTVEAAVAQCEAEQSSEVLGLAIVAGGAVVGFLLLKLGSKAPQWVPSNAAVISAMRVSVEYQGQGIGTRALEALPSWVQQHCPAIHSLVLSVDEENTAAIRSYAKAGWVDQGTRIQGRIGWVRYMSRPVFEQSPNPSIEGTSTIRLRLLAAAPHVKR